MQLNRYEDIVSVTRLSLFDRFPDGRPRVPDDLLRRMREVTVEEAWGVVKGHGYNHQYEGGWLNIHPGRVMVGRAVTAVFAHTRPDLHEAIEEWGRKDHPAGFHNSWVIDTLVENDVVVVDLFGKVKEGTFAGDNLGTAIAQKTKTGMVIHGGIRDLARLREIPDIGIFARGVDASGIAEVTLIGLNYPIVVGEATVLPGDVVLGTCAGVVFIPPHLAQEVVEKSETIRRQDYWGQMRIREGKYTSGQVDGAWTDEMHRDFEGWVKRQG
ncbi:MAG: RraA family protein [Armatimonadetes bacterium]|nr:RraA family protein [Armatimonadota bacterium]